MSRRDEINFVVLEKDTIRDFVKHGGHLPAFPGFPIVILPSGSRVEFSESRKILDEEIHCLNIKYGITWSDLYNIIDIDFFIFHDIFN